ncbi:MAG: exodeoxyribonuclease V subunit alpha [Gammaproteobacteria bacterium]|nr:exodeoxyribonuclease V subunit alpha [Rhodocyclaceae bacterium]MBU3909955.1 exodeoxyribonuclease V subunit alpha [Gammaproteobacteria bacterium]MBU3987897.1 exodeoxyribonuclease V subunit alpha [Gammaproteobacteria bacterium]MBU4003928.1 exodeoxyribonuclease V subunit alpha [Gammaproteobacteria bacterium]MBU4020175.1 exodeoxyribonuclease V subunit alpha [Gammaproteobacteria bacterium]
MAKLAIPPIVAHLSRYLGGDDPAARRAVALACQATQDGHVCADLDQEAGWGPWAGEMDGGQRAGLRARLPDMAIVGGADDLTPLVWDGQRLSLRRYWAYEQQVALDLLARATAPEALSADMEAALENQFADAGQRAAARIGLVNRLALISGGPGTGKTTTLARLIALLHQQAAQAGAAPLRIALAAPTGKAAARMTEALGATGVSAPAHSAMTLHRLLGMRADGSGFYHCRERPLTVDVLVIDEASMIDLSLMAHLLAALPTAARLILLGDRDQLAAVEAGAVFADLCASERLAPCVTTLTASFRFAGTSGIGRLAECLRMGDAPGAIEQLKAATDDLDWQPQFSPQTLASAVREGYQAYRDAVAAGLPVGELFEQFSRFRVLCAHRQDVAAINRALTPPDAMLAQPGMPVMVVRNDPLLRLYNGDIGLALPDPVDGSLKACFAGKGDGTSAAPRWIPFARLPTWEVAWAMTVHKSQGSEFARVLLALPASISPVVTRELVYTGVTRARQHLSLWSSEAVLQAACENRAGRMSGLCDKLGSLTAGPPQGKAARGASRKPLQSEPGAAP